MQNNIKYIQTWVTNYRKFSGIRWLCYDGGGILLAWVGSTGDGSYVMAFIVIRSQPNGRFWTNVLDIIKTPNEGIFFGRMMLQSFCRVNSNVSVLAVSGGSSSETQKLHSIICKVSLQSFSHENYLCCYLCRIERSKPEVSSQLGCGLRRQLSM